MNDENNMFERNERSSSDGLQPPPREDSRQGYQQPSQVGSNPVRLDKEFQPAENNGANQAGAGQQFYTGQQEEVQQPYNNQQPYNGQPGNSQQPYNGQPGNSQQPYNGQPGDSQQSYNGQQGGYQQPYQSQNQSTQLSGHAQPVYQQESQSTISGESGGFGIASMVCGILSIVTCCLWCLSVPLAVISIILGILQISKGTAKGMAIAGIICSGIGLLMMLCFLVWFAVFQASESYYDLMRDIQYMSYRYHR